MFCFASIPLYYRCDTISYPANISKVRPFQKLIEKQAFHLLKNLTNHMNSYKDKEHAKKFYDTIMYSGLPEESITKTRVYMYQRQRIKASSTLRSDEERTAQHLSRSGLQCFIWTQCMRQNMIIPKLKIRAWCMEDGKILPVWYVGKQLLQSLTRRKNRKLVNSSKYANKSDVAGDADANDEDDDY